MLLSREPLRSNVELKARLDDHDSAVAIARLLGAEDLGEERQEDTYFSMGRYRLKLRETSRGDHRLIGYSRPDDPDTRKSQYRMQTVEDPSKTRDMMARTMGVKAVVRKWRHLFLLDGRVRIHVDRVDALGTFLEFEAVLDPDSRPDYEECCAHLEVARLAHDFGIEERDLISTSYSTLVKSDGETPSGT